MQETADSVARLLDLEKQYSAYGDPVHYTRHPLLLTRCQGSWVYDHRATGYLDLTMWFASVNLGYAQPAITQAVCRQLETLPQAPVSCLHPTRIELAARLGQAAEQRFGRKGRVSFNVGGAQAVEDALKLVRMHTRSNGVFAFTGGFHGRTIATAAITSSYAYRSRFGHYGDRAHLVEFPYTFRCAEKGITDFTDYYVSKFKRLFESEFHGVYDPRTGTSEYRAFIAEPILGTGGYLIPPRNFYKELKRVLDEYGILLVADEIQMGFYRTGKLWSIEHFGVQPDVITFSKALTNGMNPLSGLWAGDELMDPEVFTPGTAYSTFAANPLGTAAAVAVLDFFEQWEGCEAEIAGKGAYFLQRLRELQQRFPAIGNVDGLGMALHMEVCEDDGWTPSKRRADFLLEEGLKGDLSCQGENVGLILKTAGFHRNVLTFSPNLLMTDDEIDLAGDLLEQLFERMRKHGL
jgi:4-aminobutyrate aminotransferase/(S)-3-amino-2-methylpropionate transaminase